MEKHNCINGKCDLRNQTTDEVLEFMTSKDKDEQEGFGFFVFEDKKEDRGMRKDIVKDITYLIANKMADEYGDDMKGWKFIPYGYLEDLDEVVKTMVDGPFEAQLPKK